MSFLKSKLQAKSHPSATPSGVNFEGGPSFEFNNPIEKLISIVGGSFFAEPRFYNAESCKFTGNKALEARVQLVKNRLTGIANTAELDITAQTIIATAIDVLNGKSPEDLLIVARWLRNKLNIRLTPQVLLVLAASHSSGQGFVRKYAPVIAVRPDEIKTCLLLWRFFFGQKLIPNCLGRGLGDAVSRFNEAALLKYNSREFPTWKDILRWLPRHTGYPLAKPLQEYFTHEKISDATPIIQARHELHRCKNFDDRAKSLIVASHANWEVVLSQFGNKPEVWSHLIEHNLVGYMALLRNLRNIADANVSANILETVCKKISDRGEILRSQQLPFRYISAIRALRGEIQGFWTTHQQKPLVGVSGKLEIALFQAMEVAAENVRELPGVTAIFSDNSGSMASPVSQKSQITCLDAANILAAMVGKRCRQAYVCAFGTDVGYIGQTYGSSVHDIYNRVLHADIKGHGTEAWKCVAWLSSQNIKTDRVIILSDMQCYTYGYGGNTLESEWEKYSRHNKNCWLHTVHLNGYGDSAVRMDKKVNLLAGFSEKLFDTMLTTEGVISTDTGKPLSTIEQIREEFRL